MPINATAAYPSSLKVYSVHQDVTDVIYAANVNDAQTEIIAIETTLGVNPQTASSFNGASFVSTAGNNFGTVNARLNNIESGLVGDSHNQYIHKAGGDVISAPSVTGQAIYLKSLLNQTGDMLQVLSSTNALLLSLTAAGGVTATGSVTAPNLLYGITVSGNLSSSGGQSPTITLSATPSFTSATIPTLTGAVNTTGNLSENGARVYSGSNVPPYPVTSVAGRTGVITLSAADIATGTFPGAMSFASTLGVTGAATFGTATAALLGVDRVTETFATLNSAATTTLDLSVAETFNVSLITNTTFAFSNVPSTTKSVGMTIVTTQDATGGRTIAWPTSVKFESGVTPSPVTTANAVNIYSLFTLNGGTTWFGFLSGKDMR